MRRFIRIIRTVDRAGYSMSTLYSLKLVNKSSTEQSRFKCDLKSFEWWPTFLSPKASATCKNRLIG